jgi:hypothetical protein
MLSKLILNFKKNNIKKTELNKYLKIYDKETNCQKYFKYIKKFI